MVTMLPECRAMLPQDRTADIRELEDMNLVPEELGGNLYLVNGSFTKLADAGAFAKKNEKEETTHEE